MSDTLMAVIFILVLWPAVIVTAALVNMLTSWVFSWSELMIDILAGILMGIFFSMGVLGDVQDYDRVLLVLFHGLPGILKWVGVGFMDSPWIVFAFSASLIVGATLVGGLLDLATRALDSKPGVATWFVSLFTWPIKAPFAVGTSVIGLLIGVVGIIIGAAKGKKVGLNFLGGALFFRTGLDIPTASATTFGWTVIVWQEELPSRTVNHELYHTRQYIYLRDMLGVFYFTIAGLWGLASAAIAAAIDKAKKNVTDKVTFSVRYFYQAHRRREVGNPIECAPYKKW